MQKKIEQLSQLTVVAAVAVTALISCVSSQKHPEPRFPASIQPTGENKVRFETIAAQGKNYDFSRKNPAQKFSSAEVEKIASSKNIKLSAGQVLKDNDLAFKKKLDVIADAEKEIRIVYYIFSDDGTSSAFTRALLEKAKTTKVRLLVDFVTNYKNLDLFNMMAAKSNGNIDVRFYNYPGAGMFADAAYITTPCPSGELKAGEVQQKFECRDHKNSVIGPVRQSILSGQISPNAKILMSGLFGKNGTAIKASLGYLAEIDPAQYKAMLAKNGESAFDKRDMFNLAELVKDALIKGDIFAKIKLSIAMTTYEAELNPLVNELTGRMPLLDSESERLWDHFTDYTHHKLILGDKNQFVLGGRNIEDSYHMDTLGKKGKYVFLDTDFWGRTKSRTGAADIAAAYDKMFDSAMVAKLSTVNEQMPNDFIANTDKPSKDAVSASEAAVGFCLKQRASPVPNFDMAGCILQALPNMKQFGYKSLEDRISEVHAQIMSTEMMTLVNPTEQNTSKREFAKYSPTFDDNGFSELSKKDLETAEFYYLENVHPIVKDSKTGDLKRVTGSKYGSEAKNGKSIHYAWYRGLEQACVVAREKKRADKNPQPGRTYVDAIFHSAYLFMPAGLVHTIAKMMNNDWGDCSGVNLMFISNSELTTDLAPINILARYQTTALFSHYHNLEEYAKNFGPSYVKFYPRMSYYEYLPNRSGMPESLHTKTTLIGDDLIIGSANSDVRSYYMDTNNALMIRNAHDLNKEYRDYIYKLIADGRVMQKSLPWNERLRDATGDDRTFALMKSLVLDHENIDSLNRVLIERSYDRWMKNRQKNPRHIEAAVRAIRAVGTDIMNDTNEMVLFRGKFDTAEQMPDMYNRQVLDKEHNELMQSFDARYKLF